MLWGVLLFRSIAREVWRVRMAAVAEAEAAAACAGAYLRKGSGGSELAEGSVSQQVESGADPR